ncbi:hypothetical protein E1281_27460 [Actinomadura sp. KC345]|uniref:hypothetical protein n=1 Tax=Actinomadura sp. KC345 TaxID=2530371 RepID=UPI0010499EF5|nr:hypothetical protein [Actinomadura sp. KC345]TDC46674.1 hypothetical protein E1281_27460 [Actinomadura sp. KC345]
MSITRSLPATAEGSKIPGSTGAPRWAVWCAWATVLCTVPSGIWRMALGFGADVGFTGRLGEMYTGIDIMVYVLALTVGSQAAAFLTLGLVRPWGETVPRWIPRLGGRRVPPLAAIVPAVLGGVAVSGLCLFLAVTPDGPLAHPEFPHGTAGVVMNISYAPLLLWGPLVLILTAHYARRRAHRPAHRPDPRR